jgi:hypothetical protein
LSPFIDQGYSVQKSIDSDPVDSCPVEEPAAPSYPTDTISARSPLAKRTTSIDYERDQVQDDYRSDPQTIRIAGWNGPKATDKKEHERNPKDVAETQ